MVAPRRIAVLVTDVPHEQTAQTQRYRGPRADVAFGPDGAPTRAGEGFARGKGLEPAALQRETVDGTEFVVAVTQAERRATELVLPDVCRRLISSLQIPRGMRWGAKPPGADDYLRFSRPLRSLVCVFAGRAVPFDFYDLRAGDVAQGHRVLGRPVIVDQASHYERHLREQGVIADQDERRRLIVEGLDAAAGRLGGRWSDPAGVLEENIYLAEWPSVHCGSFDERHLRLPDEVLITAMQAHQRYWPVEDAAGRLLPAFLYVSNADPAAAALITHGNERVLEGRLDDAEFSYDRDLAEGLEAMASRLGEVVFHARLGSLADKSARLVALAQWLAGRVGEPADREPVAAAADQGLTVRVTGELPAAVIAAKYAKADLVSQVVIEFPSLQGRVGGVYAEKAGASPAVARAIAEHYHAALGGRAGARRPGRRPGRRRRQDRQHRRRLARRREAVGLARPLRPAPRGDGHRAHLPRVRPEDPAARARGRGLAHLRASGRFGQGSAAAAPPAKGSRAAQPPSAAELESEIAAFIWERLEALLLDEGLPFALVEAALGAAARGADLPRVAALARTFARVEHEEFFNDVVVAYTRPASLAARAETEPGRGADAAAAPDPARFADEAEHALAAAVAEVREPLETALAGGDVEAALRAAAALRAPVDRYFDAVLVMDKDPELRANRLAQLRQITSLLGSLGDFARLPVQQGSGLTNADGEHKRPAPPTVTTVMLQEESMADKYVYDFSEGNKNMRELLGGKGANLAEMTVIGLPVPPGFTITTEVCNHYSAKGAYPEGLEAQVETALGHLEKNTGKRFGDPGDPLLVSVRSGARASMPGMMDTILNLGLNDTTVQGLIKSTNNPRFGYDCYRRFVSMYGDVVLGCKPEKKDDPDPFEERLDQMKKRRGVAVRHRAHRRRLEGAGRRVQAGRARQRRQDLPRGAARAALGRRHRRIRLVDERPRDRLPQALRHSRHLGHGRQRADHGLRQHRRRVGHGRGLHAQPGHRRERLLRRVPGQRPGRGRGLGRAHAAAGDRAQGGLARRLRAAHGRAPDPRARDARHAGLRVHHRARPPLHAADPQRQAHRPGRHPHRRRHGRPGPDRSARGAHAHRARPAEPAPAAGVPRRGRAGGREGRQGAGLRSAGRARRGHRPRRLLGRRRGGLGRARRAGAAGARLHEPRGHPRHGRRAGHPDRPGRHDQPRGAGRPPDGQGLHRRLRRARHRHGGARLLGRRRDRQRG